MKAWERLQKGWCQGVFARDSRGNIRHVGSEKAAYWCVVGAAFASYAPGIEPTGCDGDDIDARVSPLIDALNQAAPKPTHSTGERYCETYKPIFEWQNQSHIQQAEVVELVKQVEEKWLAEKGAKA